MKEKLKLLTFIFEVLSQIDIENLKKTIFLDSLILERNGEELAFCSCDLSDCNFLKFLLIKIYKDKYQIKELKYHRGNQIFHVLNDNPLELKFNDLEISLEWQERGYLISIKDLFDSEIYAFLVLD